MPEPLNWGTATTQTGGASTKLKVKVDGAESLVTDEVRMLSSNAGPPPFGQMVGFLSTDANGDGNDTCVLAPDAYLVGVQLWRDSDGGCDLMLPFLPPGCVDPRIVTAFVVEP